MKKIILKLSDVEDHQTIHTVLDSLIPDYCKTIQPKYNPNPFIKFKIHDHQNILKSVDKSIEDYGFYGFLPHHRNNNGADKDRSSYYGGFSISYNPDLAYPAPVHASALGEPKTNLGNFFKSDAGRAVWFLLEDKKLTPKFYKICFEQGLESVKEFLIENNIINNVDLYEWNSDFCPTKRIQKNGYFDTYGFRYLTDAAKNGDLGKFLNRFKRTIVRSRVARIDGSQWLPEMKDYMWHYDERVYLNLRINVPLYTTENYVCEIKNKGIYNLKPGTGYSWDTTVVHRVYAKEFENSFRTNLVIGSSPWFDYDHESNSYISNEFCGEMHPFDMLVNGHIFEGIELIND